MTRKLAVAALLSPLALLAACSGSDPEAPANDANTLDEGMVVENALDGPFVNASPLPEPTASPSPEATSEPPLPDDEQVQEDADATGMTARVDRQETQPADTADDAAATEAPSEKK